MDEIEEIKKRKIVWKVLSSLYLDTTLEDADYIRLAEYLKSSEYELDMIKNIDLFEVFPILQWNLVSVAGEWLEFNEEPLFKICYENYRRRSSIFFRTYCYCLNFIFYWMRKQKLEKIFHYLITLKPLASEVSLVGNWIFAKKNITEDINCQRIKYLTIYLFKKIALSKDGWSTLFQDPSDNRYWELVYLQSELQGGGPPSLCLLDETTAKLKYAFN